MLISLHDVSQYKNTQLLERYKNDYPNNALQAEETLLELIKYFWLTQKHQNDRHCYPDNEELHFRCSMHEEMKAIDDMWHTFLLFTEDYMLFCKHYFDTFIHHFPVTEEDKLSEDEFELDLTRYLSYIWDNLGEETLTTWFGD